MSPTQGLPTPQVAGIPPNTMHPLLSLRPPVCIEDQAIAPASLGVAADSVQPAVLVAAFAEQATAAPGTGAVSLLGLGNRLVALPEELALEE